MPRTHHALLPLVLFLSGAAASVEDPPAHDPAKWEKEIAAYEKSDRKDPPPQGAIVFTGSSTIRMWKTLAADLPNHRVINRGFGGCHIADCTHFADRIVIPYAPRMVILGAGSNDINAGRSARQVFDDFRAFAKRVHEKLPETKIVFLSLNPRISRWEQAETNREANALIEAYVRKHAYLGYIDTYDMPLGPDGKPRPELFRKDKLHYNEKGYELLATRVRAYLEKEAKKE